MNTRTLSGVVLVCVAALALPAPASAVAPAKKKNLGSAQVTVKGVPSKRKATITVEGPGSFTAKRRTDRGFRLINLRPGVYSVRGKTIKKGTKFYVGSDDDGRVRKGKKTKMTVRYSKAKSDPDKTPAVTPNPFASVQRPASVALISRNQGGTPGNRESAFPSYAPDGSLVFSSCASDLTGDTDACFAYRATAGSLSRIGQAFLGTDITDWGGETVVSPDGSKLAFTTLVRLTPNDQDDNKDLYVLTFADNSLNRASQTIEGWGMTGGEQVPNQASEPSWSPDNVRVAFITESQNLAAKADSMPDVFVKNPLNGDIQRFGTGFHSTKATWSPGAGTIAFGSENKDSASDVEVDSNIFVAQASGGAPTKFTSDGESFEPSWSPDGTRIAFATNSDKYDATDTNETTDVYVKDINTGAVTRISLDSAGKQTGWASSSPTWSPDSTKVAFVTDSEDFGETVMVKNLVTGTLTQLVEPGGADEVGDIYLMEDPVFAPDGSSVAFATDNPKITPGDSNKAFDVFVATL